MGAESGFLGTVAALHTDNATHDGGGKQTENEF